MDDNQPNVKDNFSDNVLPLPDELQVRHDEAMPPENRAAADLIRQKVEAAYQSQPTQIGEILEAAEESPTTSTEPDEPLSKHQQFIYELAASGRPRRDIQAAWHEYYAGLSDAEKHQVWHEFNQAHAQASKFMQATGLAPAESAMPKRRGRPPSKAEIAIRKHSKELAKKTLAKIPEQHRAPLKSLVFGLTIGFVVILIVLFTFFNERFIAPFIQPSRSIANTEVITANTPVSTKPEIIIPKINVEVPVIYWVKTTDANAVEDGLNNGVVHYADTALPGQNGNVVIVGHSAENIFNNGRYKFVFSLLRQLDIGDTFYITYNGQRYVYQIYEKKSVLPTDVGVLAPQAKPAVATLITCDPPGTSAHRLIIVGKQISPSTANNKKAAPNHQAVARTTILPSQAPSLWSRLTHWFTH